MKVKPCVHLSKDGKCMLIDEDKTGFALFCFMDKEYLRKEDSPNPEDLCDNYEDGEDETELPEDFGMDY